MKNYIKKRKRNTVKIIQILLFTTVIVVCVTLSKYKTALATKATAVFANPKTILIDEINLDELRPGESITTNFRITNSEKEKTSDVQMIYTIAIETGNYLPLKFDLKKIENGESVGSNLLNEGGTEEIEMPKNKYDQEYQLTITWDNSEKNYLYSDEIDYVKIIMNSYQKSI